MLYSDNKDNEKSTENGQVFIFAFCDEDLPTQFCSSCLQESKSV